VKERNAISSSTQALVQQLSDLAQADSASKKLVELGTGAVPALLRAAEFPQNGSHYQSILRALLTIEDPRTEGLFRRALASNDPQIRAIGARGLHRLKAADALNALEVVINDAPDPLHSVQTPAVQSLIESGMTALPTVFTLLKSADENSRQRAQHVLAAVVLRDITQRLQPRPLTSDAQVAWEKLSKANGSYRWDAPEAARSASVALWEQWFNTGR
jgi:HEAT repeat protein